MTKISKFEYLLSKNIVQELYEKREDTIYSRTLDEKEEIKELLEKNVNDYESILKAIDNIPNAFVETRKMIRENVDNKIESMNKISGYDNEKFYKIGFYDAVNLIIESLANK